VWRVISDPATRLVVIVLLDPAIDSSPSFLQVAIPHRSSFLFLQAAVKPFDVAVAFWETILRPPAPTRRTRSDVPRVIDVRHFTTTKLPITRASIPELKNVQMASVGVHTIASPRRLNDVFNMTSTPVRLPNSSISRQ
jgi:hypothetical protein